MAQASYRPPVSTGGRRWPGCRGIIRRVLLAPFHLLRFLLSLPLHLIRFIIHLPRNIWQLWTRGARGIVTLEQQIARLWRGGKAGVRLLRLYFPRQEVARILYTRLHPLRLWHGLCALRLRLKPTLWDARPGLAHIPRALEWARQYRRHHSRFEDIEALRSILYADDTPLPDEPLRPPVGLIGRRLSVRPRWGAFLHGLTRYSGAQRILEVGTGYGISGLYLARGLLENYPVRTCLLITLEQEADRANYARNNFYRLGFKDIADVRTGEVALTLEAALKDIAPLNMAFIDGLRDHDAILRTVAQIKRRTRPGALIILTGIHSSPEMARAWRAVQHMPQIAATVDLWQWGVLVTGQGPALHLCARL
ncbi:MAG: hypothetical protein HPY64_10385 [Anaerolineae bacterium]|nr:hypothetical protein [Anaerolineae bacterium]